MIAGKYSDRDKMDAVLQRTFSNSYFLRENCFISIQISVKFVCKGLINSKPGLV